MISVSDDVKKIYKSDVSPGPITLTIDGTAYTNQNWLSGSLDIVESVCSKDTLDYSQVESNTLEVTLAKESGNIANLKDKVIVAKQTVNSIDVPLGTFTIDTPEYDGDYYTKIKAYDYMKKFIDKNIDDWWNATLTFPMTLRQLLIALCDYVGVSYSLPDTWANSSITINRNAFLNKATGSDLLGQIQLVSGCFFHTDRNGVLKKVTNDAAVTEIPYTSLMEDATIGDYSTPSIDNVMIKASDNDVGISAGDGKNVYVIQANYLLYNHSNDEVKQIATNILTEIGSKSYKPFKATFKAQEYLECGDPVKITSYKGNTVSYWIMYQKFTDDALITQSVEDKGSASTITPTQSSKKQITILNQKMHEMVNDIDTLSSKITNVSSYVGPFYLGNKNGGNLLTRKGLKIRLLAGPGYHSIQAVKTENQSIIEQTSEKIVLSVIKNYETITDAETMYKSLSSSITQTAENITLEVDKKVSIGTVRDKFATESSSISITSGTITFSTGTLIVSSDNFTLDKDGNMSASGNAKFSGKITSSTVQFGDDTNNMLMSNSDNKLLFNSTGTYGMKINASGSFDAYANPVSSDTNTRNATLHALNEYSEDVATVSSSSSVTNGQRYGASKLYAWARNCPYAFVQAYSFTNGGVGNAHAELTAENNAQTYSASITASATTGIYLVYKNPSIPSATYQSFISLNTDGSIEIRGTKVVFDCGIWHGSTYIG